MGYCVEGGGRAVCDSGGLSGVLGGSFTGELKWRAPTPARQLPYQTTGKPYERCAGGTGGAASPAQLARFQPGGDLEYLLTKKPVVVSGGNICLGGTVMMPPRVVTQFQAVAAVPGGWFLHHSTGGVSRIVNPPSAWGRPSANASRGQTTLVGRKDDRSIPWALAIDADTAKGQLYFEPTPPPQAVDRTDVETLDAERVAELKAEMEAEGARRREALEEERRRKALEEERRRKAIQEELDKGKLTVGTMRPGADDPTLPGGRAPGGGLLLPGGPTPRPPGGGLTPRAPGAVAPAGAAEPGGAEGPPVGLMLAAAAAGLFLLRGRQS